MQLYTTFITQLLFILLLASPLMAQKEETIYVPAEYDTLYEEIKVKDDYYRLIHHPAILDTIMVEVKVKEKSKILKESWKTSYSFTKKPEADSIGGKWVGVKDKNCVSPNPEDCRYEIWVPDSPEYDFKETTNYLGAVWDEQEESPEVVIYVPRIIEVKPARVERIYVPAEYQTIEKYVLKKRAKIIRKPKTN
jgi:hypothetical protein